MNAINQRLAVYEASADEETGGAYTDFNVARVISDVLYKARSAALGKPIEMVVDVKPDFPATMCGDETALRQILTYLMSNAVKRTKFGRITLYASFIFDIGAAKRRGFAVFSVKDTGAAIKRQDARKLSEALAQRGGPTYGLAEAGRLARSMRGSISFASERGKGSVFTVWLRRQVKNYAPIGDIGSLSVKCAE